MSFIDKVNSFTDSLSSRFYGSRANGVKSYEDEEILDDFGVPERVYIIYNSDKNETNIRLMEEGECYGEKTVKGDKTDYYLDLYLEECDMEDEDVVTISTISGGKKGGFPKVNNFSKLKSEDVFSLDAQGRAAVNRALLQMQSEEKAPKIYLDGPLTLSENLFPTGKEAVMSLYTFFAEGFENNLNGFDVLDNLARIDAKAFGEDLIESVVVSKDRTKLTFNSKDNKTAHFNLTNGRRTIYDNETGMPVMADSNGPVIKS